MDDLSRSIDRRTVLRLGALATAGFGGAGLLAACGGSSKRRARSVPSTDHADVRQADNRCRSVEAVVAARRLRAGDARGRGVDLHVEGTLPNELAGLYVRNGSNPKPGWSPHWFLGDGMVHGVMLEGGKATWYRNRYVHTTLLAAGGGLTAKAAPGGAAGPEQRLGRAPRGQAADARRGRPPVRVARRRSSTVGAYDFGGRLKGNMTAHPKIDPATGHDALLRVQLQRAVPRVPRRRSRRRARVEPAGRGEGVDDDPRLRDHRARRRVLGDAGPVRHEARDQDDQRAALDGHAVRVEARVRIARSA